MGRDETSEPNGAAEGGVPLLVPEGAEAGEPPIAIAREFMLIGNRRRAHLRLGSTDVSRCHAALMFSQSTLYIRDLASRTGVLVNGARVRETELVDGDFLQIGEALFRIEYPASERRATKQMRAAPASLQGHEATVRIEGRGILIGRHSACDVRIDDSDVSSRHAVVFELNGVHHVRDLYTRTGTWVNKVQVKMCQLLAGDVVRIGKSEFRYGPCPPAAASGPSASPIDLVRLDDEDGGTPSDQKRNEPIMAAAGA